MKRLAVYFHYDARGRIDQPCRLAVQSMRPFAQLLFVTNGALGPEERAWVEGTGAELLERENTGFDVGAYRDALLHCGQETVCGFDELVLMNFTLAGPVSGGRDEPLRRMFETMAKRPELDFWGLTRHYAMRSRRFGGRVPEHLQSHFLAVRGRLLRDPAFWDYWRQMRLPRSYEESVTCHETRFTEYFAEKGFRWDSYVQTDDLRQVFLNPIMACPRELIEKRGCPFFKRRSFFTPYADELRRTDGTASRELYEYLCRETAYPVEALLASLLQDYPLADLACNLPWHYILAPGEESGAPDLAGRGLRLLRFAPLPCEGAAAWYLEQSAAEADKHLAAAAALFEKNPRLGLLCPAWPSWPPSGRACAERWRAVYPGLAEEEKVPAGLTPPKAPVAGWALVREAALHGADLDLQSGDCCWRLPLRAQKNGFYSAVFETAAHAAARAEQLWVYQAASEAPSAVAKQLGRLVKHKLERR